MIKVLTVRKNVNEVNRELSDSHRLHFYGNIGLFWKCEKDDSVVWSEMRLCGRKGNDTYR